MKSIRKWFETREAIVAKKGGLAEKEEATEKKLKVAMKILSTPIIERRKHAEPVTVERRVEIYDYHQKLA